VSVKRWLVGILAGAACVAVYVGGTLVLAPAARAEGLSPEVRHAVEIAFFQGRYEDVRRLLEGVTTPEDRWPLEVLDSWWRGPATQPPPVGEHAGGGEGPYPLVAALVRERVRRERDGGAGLPEKGPVEAWWVEHEPGLTDPEHVLLRQVYDMMIRNLRGDEDAYEASQLDDEARKADMTAQIIWLASLGAFVVLGFFGMLLVVRRGTLPDDRRSAEAD